MEHPAYGSNWRGGQNGSRSSRGGASEGKSNGRSAGAPSAKRARGSGGRGRGGRAGPGHGASASFGKRKADADMNGGRPSRRPRSEEQGPYMDEAYIRETQKLPQASDYPTARASLFAGDSVVSQLSQSIQNLSIRTAFREATFSNGAQGFRCTLTARLPNMPAITGDGDGQQKKTALRAAQLALLSKLHVGGTLQEWFPSDTVKLDQDTLQAEADATMEVYDYAAKFGLTPTLSVRTLPRIGRKKGAGFVELTVELAEQGIKASAKATRYQNAEIGACLQFKQEAEKYHAKHGDSTMVIKDSGSLSTSNAKDFWEFFHMRNRGEKLDVNFNHERNVAAGGSILVAQPTLNGEAIGNAVRMHTKKKAETLAMLVAAVELTKRQPELKGEFLAALSKTGGGVLMPVKPLDVRLDPEAVMLMGDTLHSARQAGLPDDKDLIEADETNEGGSRHRFRHNLRDDEAEAKSKRLQSRLQAFENDDSLAELRKKRSELPMTQYREKVLKQIAEHNFSVVVGATGSGKTTQVPQLILDEAIAKGEGAKCNIVCTQPRRIAATSVARRVAEERNEKLQESVGYHVRFDVKLPRVGGSIVYCTTGILLQQLQRQPDEVMDSLSHIIIDEVHERDILIDFLLILVKKNARARIAAGKSVPKIVLMSATIDSELFAQYFEYKTPSQELMQCPSISVPGRTFPVQEKYFSTIMDEMIRAHGDAVTRFTRPDMDSQDYIRSEQSFRASAAPSREETEDDEQVEAAIDWKRERSMGADGSIINEKEDGLMPIRLIAATVAHLCKTTDEGAILVFLPGYDEIKKVFETLRDHRPFGVDIRDATKYKAFTLHSSVPASEQQEVFNPVEKGVRKVILSTNIAETSVTIPDIQYVVDTGKIREKRYDQVRRITKLQCTWVSKSNAKQRAGRAGRVQNGNYYALYSRPRYESLRAIGLPEMLRSDLQEICLDIKAQAFSAPIREFLAEAIEPPAPEAVDASVVNLQALEALTEEEQLTALGRVLAALPVHPSLGKMIILGVVFRCLDPLIVLGAAMNERPLFVKPPEKKAQALAAHSRFLEGTSSDHFALVNAFAQVRLISEQRGQQAAFSFCMDNFIHQGAFRTISSTCKQIEEVLVDAGLIPYTAPHEHFEGEFGHPSLNKNSGNVGLIKALLLAGLHPNLAVAYRGPLHRTPGEKNAIIHPGSMNASIRGRRGGEAADVLPAGTLLTYSTMARSNDGKQIYLRDTTVTSSLGALLFGGRLRSREDTANILVMDGWLPFYMHSSNRGVTTLIEFRKALDRLLTKTFQDVARHRQQERRPRGQQMQAQMATQGLADDPLREIFADGVVQVLDRDTPSRRPVRW